MKLIPDFIKFKVKVKNYSPVTCEDAAEILHLYSVMSERDKDLKKQCYDVLATRCGEKVEEFTSPSGLSVQHIVRKKKVYNPSPEIDAANKKLEEAKTALKDAQDAAGFTEVVDADFWQAKK